MARPEKQEHEQRRWRPNPRYTQAEEAIVRRNAALAGLSVPEYIRQQSLGGVVQAPSSTRSDPALITKINTLALQLRKAGVTANKMAVAVHSDRKFPIRWQQVADALDEARADAEAVLSKLV